MPFESTAVLPEDLLRFRRVLERLVCDAGARAAFLVNRNGEPIVSSGDLGGADPTSLGSLTAGNVAATRGLARLLGEPEFSVLLHEGTREHLHISVVSGGVILLVRFDQRASLGLVRLRARRATAELARILQETCHGAGAARSAVSSPSAVLAGVSDEEIDALLR